MPTDPEKTTLVLAAENVAKHQRAVAAVVPHAGNVWTRPLSEIRALHEGGLKCHHVQSKST